MSSLDLTKLSISLRDRIKSLTRPTFIKRAKGKEKKDTKPFRPKAKVKRKKDLKKEKDFGKKVLSVINVEK